MPRYIIERQFSVGEAQMPGVGQRSRQIIEQQFPEITWEHSHVAVDDDGHVRTFCIYAAPTEELLREHARQLGQHQIAAIHEVVGDVTPADFPG
jgi:hypothetical protein